jgi:branched-chain amino acid transport system substrate-binding protein
MPRSRGSIVALAVALALGVAACGSDSDSGSDSSGAASSGEPIKLGVLAGLTGDSSAIGVPYVNGVKMAVDEVNADGGVDGRNVEIETADNKTEPVAGVQAGMKLVRTGDIDALLCSCYSTIFFPLMNGLSKQDIVVTNDASSTPEVRELPGTIITTLPTDDVLGAALGKFAYDLGYKEASLISVNDPYGQAFTPVVSEAYEKAGGKLLEEIMVEGGLPNYRPEVSRIAKAGADALLMGSYTDDARLQFKQLSEAGWDGVAFKLYPTGNRLNEDKESNNRFYGLEGTWLASENKEWRDKYEAEFGEEPTIWAAIGYDAAMLNALGIAAAGSDKAEDIRASMVKAAETYEGPTGKLKFDDSFVRVDAPLAYYVVRDGKYVEIDENGEDVEPAK